MTKANMLAEIRAAGCTARVVDGEIQLRPYPGAPESSIYFTDCRDDAVMTARAINASRERWPA